MKVNQLGFGGQWVDGTPIGQHVDSDGDLVKVDAAFLEAVVANFEKTKHLHQPPAVIGHPKTTAPAYGYVAELRLNNGRLERRFSQVNPEFEEIVKSGAYKKRSDAFYLDPKIAPGGLVPALNHVGFLGAKAPAIKGIADIEFSEDEGRHVDVEVDTAINFSEGDAETMKDEDVKKTIRESVAEFFKPISDLLSGSKPANGNANFSEGDVKRVMDEAVRKVETSFTEKITALEQKNEELQKRVDGQIGSSKRAEVGALVAQYDFARAPIEGRHNSNLF